MSLNLDFSDVKNPLISEGDHTFEITDVKMAKTKKGDDMLKITSTVVSEGEDEGKKNLLMFPIMESTLWNLQNFLEIFGFDTSGQLDLEPEDLVGQTFVGTIAHTEDGSRTYANVVAFGEA